MFRGIVQSFDTEGDQVLVDRIEQRDPGTQTWSKHGEVTGALLFEHGTKVMWFEQLDGDDNVEEEFDYPWERARTPPAPPDPPAAENTALDAKASPHGVEASLPTAHVGPVVPRALLEVEAGQSEREADTRVPEEKNSA